MVVAFHSAEIPSRLREVSVKLDKKIYPGVVSGSKVPLEEQYHRPALL